MYMVPLMFMGMFMHVHACSCMLNSGCPTAALVLMWSTYLACIRSEGQYGQLLTLGPYPA